MLAQKAQARKLLYYGVLSMSSALYQSNTVTTIPDYQIFQLKILPLSHCLNRFPFRDNVNVWK